MKMIRNGFTIIEIVVVLGIIAICAGILVTLFVDHNRLYKSETAELNITADARIALDDIDNYVRQSNRTLSSYSTFTAGPQVLILQIQSVNASRQLIAGTYDNVVFYLSSGSLLFQVFPNVASTRVALTKKIASNVTNLTFTYNNASFDLVTEVSTSLTILESAGIQNRSITLSSKAKLRNY